MLDNLRDLVVKPANESGGYGILIGDCATDAQLTKQAEVIEADVHEPQTLSRLVAGCDAMVSLAGILHERRPGDFARAHTELPRRIVDACRANAVRRLVHVSALKAAHDAPSEYLRTKAGGEQRIKSCGRVFTGAFQVPSVAWRLHMHLNEVEIFPFGPGTALSMGATPLSFDPRYPVYTKTRHWLAGSTCVRR